MDGVGQEGKQGNQLGTYNSVMQERGDEGLD